MDRIGPVVMRRAMHLRRWRRAALGLSCAVMAIGTVFGAMPLVLVFVLVSLFLLPS